MPLAVTTFGDQGEIIEFKMIDSPDDPPAPADPAAVLAEVDAAREEVSGYAENNGARQAVERLANAIQAMVEGSIL